MKRFLSSFLFIAICLSADLSVFADGQDVTQAIVAASATTSALLSAGLTYTFLRDQQRFVAVSTSVGVGILAGGCSAWVVQKFTASERGLNAVLDLFLKSKESK